MYAVFVSGGKQYRVSKGALVRLATLDVAEGDACEFDQVLMVGMGADVKVGIPTVAGAKVIAEVVQHGREKKIEILKFKRRKHHMKRMGHRQNFTEIRVKEIIQ